MARETMTLPSTEDFEKLEKKLQAAKRYKWLLFIIGLVIGAAISYYQDEIQEFAKAPPTEETTSEAETSETQSEFAKAPPTEETTSEAETSETQSEKLPYSWTEGVFLITIEEVFEYDERSSSIAENYHWYKLRVSYKNTSHMTTKANINIGDFKLKTDKGNLYDLKYVGCESCYYTFDPEATHDYPPCTFRIQKGEKPVELWFYKTIEPYSTWPKYAEEPIIFKLEARPTEQTAL